MALEIIQVEYYSTSVEDQISSSSNLLSEIAEAGVDFHAFQSITAGEGKTRFTFFAKESYVLSELTNKSRLELDGPYSALFVKGDEKAGELAHIYKKLAQAGIQVNEAFGIADINEGYGVILYLNQEDCSKASIVLEN